MKISDVVRHKGDTVVTVRSDATVKELLALLAEHRIGAVVVSDDDRAVNGIVSERDVVRHLHSGGAEVLDGPGRPDHDQRSAHLLLRGRPGRGSPAP
jgi:FOG: CBS domain